MQNLRLEDQLCCAYAQHLEKEGYIVRMPYNTESTVDIIAEKDDKTLIIEVKKSADSVSIDRAVGQLLRCKVKTLKQDQKCDKVIFAAVGVLPTEVEAFLKEIDIEYRDLSFIANKNEGIPTSTPKPQKRTGGLTEKQRNIIKYYLKNNVALEGIGQVYKAVKDPKRINFTPSSDDITLIVQFLEKVRNVRKCSSRNHY